MKILVVVISLRMEVPPSLPPHRPHVGHGPGTLPGQPPHPTTAPGGGGGCDKPYTSSDKWTASVLSGLTFLLVSSPSSYSISNGVVDAIAEAVTSDRTPSQLNISTPSGKPTVVGLVVHSLLYAAIIRLMMEKRGMSSGLRCKNPYTQKDKYVTALVGGLLFMVVSSPFLYSTINSLTSKIGFETIQEDGTPNVQGLLLHTALFTVITRVIMR